MTALCTLCSMSTSRLWLTKVSCIRNLIVSSLEARSAGTVQSRNAHEPCDKEFSRVAQIDTWKGSGEQTLRVFELSLHAACVFSRFLLHICDARFVLFLNLPLGTLNSTNTLHYEQCASQAHSCACLVHLGCCLLSIVQHVLCLFQRPLRVGKSLFGNALFFSKKGDGFLEVTNECFTFLLERLHYLLLLFFH